MISLLLRTCMAAPHEAADSILWESILGSLHGIDDRTANAVVALGIRIVESRESRRNHEVGRCRKIKFKLLICVGCSIIHGERVPFLSWMLPISYDKKEFSLFATRNLLRQGIPQHFALNLIWCEAISYGS